MARDRELLGNINTLAETARDGEEHCRDAMSHAILYTAHREKPMNKNLVISRLQVRPHKDIDNGLAERGRCTVILSPFNARRETNRGAP